MDPLDGVLPTAVPLLKRVDEVLSLAGAPPDHHVWPSIRRVCLLPWDAVQAVAALRPDDLSDAALELRADARSYAGIAGSLPAPDVWSGEAAEAYDASRRRTASHLSGAVDSLDERLEATADVADALIDWMRQTRSDLAVTLAEVLTSAEGLSLSAETPVDPTAVRDAQAAAEVAVRVLETVANSYDAALDLITRSADLATPSQT